MIDIMDDSSLANLAVTPDNWASESQATNCLLTSNLRVEALGNFHIKLTEIHNF